ncbi:DNA polymerase Y family protein [Microbacterium sp. STN6]|uniref:DNA polymerase Y family protein n=1 Tax=Microbacterium sp. STN6 TaxID=2995588 RepID=UPI002260D997|nr:DNA polymerase Y family protein [Microbacterium sp. STN6]MCX7521466.1 DNA polymerase Y family protein [Microbacterium sp. STN6]
MPAPSSSARAIVLWVPDWPVVAALQTAHAAALARAGDDIDDGAPVAVIDRGRVYACSASARTSAVRRGLRVREAQARCPELRTIAYDPVLDARAFEPVLALVEALMPGVQPIRPGLCAIRARGPARFYGGEREAVQRLLGELAAFGLRGCRIGIADGIFAAEQAARHPESISGAESISGTESISGAESIHIVPMGEAARFLAPLPVGILGDPGLTTLLVRLGLRSLGDFAALDAAQVRQRFGEVGAHAHALAGGDTTSGITPRAPQRDLDVGIDLEPPLERIDQVTFAFRTAAERFIAQVSAMHEVCTAVRVSIRSESGQVSEREWQHPRWFTASDVLDRVRWQLQGSGSAAGALSSAICRVAVSPGSRDAASNHEEGLWGSAPDERIHHGLSRVQGLLGHDAVVTPVLGGGRMLAERAVLVAWGDREPADAAASRRRPWPGQLPPPLPARVFSPPRPAVVRSPAGESVTVDERGRVSAPLAQVGVDGQAADVRPNAGRPNAGRPNTGQAADAEPPALLVPQLRAVTAWAGPWSVDERWWDRASARRLHRFQVVDDTGEAWLLLQEGDRWLAEARYD